MSILPFETSSIIIKLVEERLKETAKDKVISFCKEKFTSHRLLKFVNFSFSHYCLWPAYSLTCYYLVFDWFMVSNFIIGFWSHFWILMAVNAHLLCILLFVFYIIVGYLNHFGLFFTLWWWMHTLHFGLY